MQGCMGLHSIHRIQDRYTQGAGLFARACKGQIAHFIVQGQNTGRSTPSQQYCGARS